MLRTTLKQAIVLEIQRVMDQQGLDHRVLAGRLGCTVANVTQLMAKKGGLQLTTVEELAAALGCRVELRLVPLQEEAESSGLAAPVPAGIDSPRLLREELQRSSVRMRGLLYGYVSACYFRAGPPEEEGDRRCWRFSPEECRLKVHFLDGCWFALWSTPESGDQVVRFGVDAAGRLVHYQVSSPGLPR